MKIICYEAEKWEAEYLKQKLAGFDLVFAEGCDIQGDPEAEVICNFVGSPLTREMLDGLPKLKLVATRSTGFDHIDIKACQDKNITVCTVPAYGENTVAEFTFALLLTLSRKIYCAAKQVRERGLFSTDELQGFDLQNKILGVIGTGHIGAYVIKIAKGFGMEVIAYDPFPRPELAQQYGFKYASLEELLKASDVITLHVPYMPATHHLINAENIGLVKPNAVLINTARGGLVETSALVKALETGQLAGAGLDVLEEEGHIKEELELLANGHPNEDQLKTLLADHKLMYMDNVIVTPHNAFNTKEAIVRILDTTIDNIKKFAEGKAVNVVR
jgi:D-lactate dehydrogenase